MPRTHQVPQQIIGKLSQLIDPLKRFLTLPLRHHWGERVRFQ